MKALNKIVDVIFVTFNFVWQVLTSKWFYRPALVVGLVFSLDLFFSFYDLRSPITIGFRNPVVLREVKVIEKMVISPVAKEEVIEEEQVWKGTASYYTWDGCVGCHPDRIMANGQQLDDNALTVAFNKLPLGSRVKVTNPVNGMSVEAAVTDTGGFEELGRIIDLTLATKTAIGCGDLCEVEVREL